jgi:hypothetical protein
LNQRKPSDAPTIAPVKTATSPAPGTDDLEIVGDPGVIGDIDKDGVGRGRNGHGTDGETVETVGEIHRVGGAEQDDHHEREIEQTHGDQHALEERHRQGSGVGGFTRHGSDRDPGRQPDHDLEGQFLAGGETEVAAISDLDPVIGKADGGEGHRDQQDGPNIPVAQIGPEQGRQHCAADDEDASHGWSPRLDLVVSRAFFPNGLADLQRPHPLDEPWTDHEDNEEGG